MSSSILGDCFVEDLADLDQICYGEAGRLQPCHHARVASIVMGDVALGDVAGMTDAAVQEPTLLSTTVLFLYASYLLG